MEQSFSWLFASLGIIGILIHLVVKVMEQGGKTVKDFWVYVRDNNLVFVFSLLTYIAIVALWYTEGFEMLGFIKGELTGATIFVAYMATSLFKSIAGIRTQLKNGNGS